jgi:hypothetical protein
MLRHAVIVCVAFASHLHGQTVVPNDNILFAVDPSGDIGFRVSKYIQHGFGADCDPVGCFTDISMQYDGQTLQPATVTLDEQSDCFLVAAGVAFTATAVSAGQFPVIHQTNWPDPAIVGQVVVGPGEFYLGVRTGAGFDGGPPNRTAYGWVRLRPNDGTLTMVENVMSYNSPGIVVGTTIVVPEPPALAFIGWLLWFLADRNRRD